MRDEFRKLLSAIQFAAHHLAMAIVVILTLLGCVAWLIWEIPSGPAREAVGEVRTRWAQTKRDMLQHTLTLQVHLDDGRHVVVTSTFPQIPAIGSRVLLRDESNLFGYHRYYWDGLVPQPPKPAP
ncbi:MAG: hypothetical protein ABL901_05220 [Hyphomicrobiaceae bacterium]